MIKTIEQETCCGSNLLWEEGNGVDYNWKTAECPSCLTLYAINLGSMQIYQKVIGEQSFRHNECGQIIKLAPVAHTVSEKTSDVNYGEVVFEYVPYCPKHELKPKLRGNPVYYGPLPHTNRPVDLDEFDVIVNVKGQVLERKDKCFLKNNFTELLELEDLFRILDEGSVEESNFL